MSLREPWHWEEGESEDEFIDRDEAYWRMVAEQRKQLEQIRANIAACFGTKRKDRVNILNGRRR